MDEIIELILQVRAGDSNAFSQMCEQYSNLLDGVSQKYASACNDTNLKEDFLQEAKMAFYNAAMRYNIEESKVTFGAYAKVCVRNRLISCIRKLNSQKRRMGEGTAEDGGSWSLQDTVVRRELGEKLISVADGILSKYEKRIFSLYLEGRKAKEISRIVARNERSVNNAIYRIRLKLKKTVTK